MELFGKDVVCMMVKKKKKYSQGKKTPLSHRHYLWKLRQGGLNGARPSREDCVLLPLLTCVLCSSASGWSYRLELGGQQWSQGNSTHRREIRRGCELLYAESSGQLGNALHSLGRWKPVRPKGSLKKVGSLGYWEN